MALAPTSTAPPAGDAAPRAAGRLLFAVHSAKRGGAQLVALGQARALAQRHELVVAIEDGPLRDEFAALGDIVDGPPRLPVWGASPARWALQSGRSATDAARLARVIRGHRLNAVVTNSSTTVAAVLAARLARVPALVQVQEGPSLQGAGALLALHRRLAQTVVVISPTLAARPGRGGARVVVNPVGITVGPAPERVPRHAGDAFDVLVVASLDHNKGQDVAVRALARLVTEGVDATLTLAGPPADPAFAAEVDALATALGVANRVAFLGPRASTRELMRTAGALVVASRAELTPLVLMEALAERTPVVATRVGGVPDIVEDGRTGLLVASEDDVALATALARLARDPELAGRLADAGRRHVEERFDERDAHARLGREIELLLGTAAFSGGPR